MTTVQRVALLVSVTLLSVVLAGVMTRKLYRICHTFPPYLAAVWAGDLLQLLWPSRFHTWTFWMAKETLYGALKLALAVEITALAYSAFPAAQATARRTLLAVLAGLLLLFTLGVPYGADLPTLARELQGRLAQGTAITFSATWALVLWYRLPLHRLHRAIMRGLVPYMLVFAAANGLTLAFGWDIRTLVNLADAAAYSLVLAYWSWEVWRRPPAEPPFLRRLQPWRARV